MQSNASIRGGRGLKGWRVWGGAGDEGWSGLCGEGIEHTGLRAVPGWRAGQGRAGLTIGRAVSPTEDDREAAVWERVRLCMCASLGGCRWV